MDCPLLWHGVVLVVCVCVCDANFLRQSTGRLWPSSGWILCQRWTLSFVQLGWARPRYSWNFNNLPRAGMQDMISTWRSDGFWCKKNGACTVAICRHCDLGVVSRYTDKFRKKSSCNPFSSCFWPKNRKYQKNQAPGLPMVSPEKFFDGNDKTKIKYKVRQNGKTIDIPNHPLVRGRTSAPMFHRTPSCPIPFQQQLNPTPRILSFSYSVFLGMGSHVLNSIMKAHTAIALLSTISTSLISLIRTAKKLPSTVPASWF